MFFEKRRCFDDQYRTYFLPEINRTIDTSSALDENIADNVGATLAYLAYSN